MKGTHLPFVYALANILFTGATVMSPVAICCAFANHPLFMSYTI